MTPDTFTGGIMNGISVLLKETSERPFAPSTTWGHSCKMPIYEAGSGHLPDNESAYTLLLDFPALELWEIGVYCKLPSLLYFCDSNLSRISQFPE